MKYFLKVSLLTVLLALFVLAVPGKAEASIYGYNYEEEVETSDYNVLSHVYYFKEGPGKYSIKASSIYKSFSGVKDYDSFDFYIFDSAGNRVYSEVGVKNVDFVENTSFGVYEYEFKGTFAPGEYTFGAYGYSGSKKGDKILLIEGSKISIPYDPYADIETINMAEGAKAYSGVISSPKSAWQLKLYKLNVTEDAMLNINNVKLSSEYSFNITVCEYNGAPSDSNQPVSQTSGYQSIKKTGGKLENYSLKKGVYYLKVEGPQNGTYSFNMELRKYRHSKVKWTIKEGGINSSFPQNKVLHVTMQITNKDSDGRIPKNATFSAAGYIDDTKINVSSDGLKGTFTFRTRTFPTVDTVCVYLDELTLSNEENKVKDMCLFTLDITTGISMSNFEIETGPNYILFPTFRSTMYVDDGKTKVNVYLKTGKKWKKKFTANAGSNQAKRIKKLKPKKKYKVKIEVVRKLTNGKTVKNHKIVTVKTGPKIKPVITSARVSNYKREKSWVPGHYDANFVWHKGYYTYNTSYTMSITLAKPLKGCKGLVYEGVKCSGSGTTFTFNVMHRDPPSKATVRGYSDNKYFGYTNVSNSKSVTK